jgi:hypothetical protein
MKLGTLDGLAPARSAPDEQPRINPTSAPQLQRCRMSHDNLHRAQSTTLCQLACACACACTPAERQQIVTQTRRRQGGNRALPGLAAAVYKQQTVTGLIGTALPCATPPVVEQVPPGATDVDNSVTPSPSPLFRHSSFPRSVLSVTL